MHMFNESMYNVYVLQMKDELMYIHVYTTVCNKHLHTLQVYQAYPDLSGIWSFSLSRDLALPRPLLINICPLLDLVATIISDSTAFGGGFATPLSSRAAAQ